MSAHNRDAQTPGTYLGPGCREKEISAVTGHTTLKEVARYTRAADQKRLAAEAVAKLTEQKLDNLSSNVDVISSG